MLLESVELNSDCAQFALLDAPDVYLDSFEVVSHDVLFLYQENDILSPDFYLLALYLSVYDVVKSLKYLNKSLGLFIIGNFP